MTKKEALQHLNERRKFFLDKNLFGRAETMSEIMEVIKNKPETYDFSHVKTAGIYLERFEPNG